MTLEEMKVRWPKLVIESIPNFVGIYNIKNVLNQILTTTIELDTATLELMDHINDDWYQAELMSNMFPFLHIDPFQVSIKANGMPREFLFETPYKFDIKKLSEYNDRFKEVSINYEEIFHCHRCKRFLFFNPVKNIFLDKLLDEKTAYFIYKDDLSRYFCNECSY